MASTGTRTPLSLGAPLVVGAALCIAVSACGGQGGSTSGAGGAGGEGGQGGISGSSSTGGMGGAGASGTGGMGGGGSTTSSSSSSTGSGMMSSDPCAGASDGNHCGAELGGLADHNTLYTCAGGATSSTQACSLGCENSACKVTPPQQDPCASAMSGNGAYCGSSLAGGDPSALYNCQNGKTASKTTCPAGCQVNPPGVADACKAAGDPCANANAGNGAYCGASINGDPNALYDCQNKVTASKTDCPAGCQQNPPGVADACKPTGGGSCCVAKPPGVLTQSYSACGAGGSHYGIDYGTPVGTPIYAPMAGTVVGSALGFPNCYDNGCTQSCWNSFNYVKVKSDCGDPADGNKDLFVYYLHINELASGIGNGVHVEQGQLLAYSGNSGCSSGPHIHIETVSVPKGQGASLSTCSSVNPETRYCP